jgi:hypothetical protein
MQGLHTIPFLLMLFACGGEKDQSEDTAVDADGDGYFVAQDCDDSNGDVNPGAEPGGSFPLQSGTWIAIVDEDQLNECENTVGHGIHIHVCEPGACDTTDFDLSREGSCVDGADDDVGWTGTQEGDQIVLYGTAEFPIGTCVLGIDATLTGNLDSDETFSYDVDAEFFVLREGVCMDGSDVDYEDCENWQELSDACDLIIGEQDQHWFSKLPCSQAWTGRAGLGQAPEPLAEGGGER